MNTVYLLINGSSRNVLFHIQVFDTISIALHCIQMTFELRFSCIDPYIECRNLVVMYLLQSPLKDINWIDVCMCVYVRVRVQNWQNLMKLPIGHIHENN